MNGDDRRAARAAYKERKTVAGIYAVRCPPAGKVWVGQAQNVDTVRTRLWFGLRLGTSMHRDLQAAWSEHGAESFAFEVLEAMEEEDIAYVRDAVLKERMLDWRARLGAGTI